MSCHHQWWFFFSFSCRHMVTLCKVLFNVEMNNIIFKFGAVFLFLHFPMFGALKLYMYIYPISGKLHFFLSLSSNEVVVYGIKKKARTMYAIWEVVWGLKVWNYHILFPWNQTLDNKMQTVKIPKALYSCKASSLITYSDLLSCTIVFCLV